MTNVPAPVIEVFDLLRIELVWIHARWKVFKQLFAVSQKRIRLLNECGAAAFRFIQDVMFDDVKLGLCRLTDPASSMGGRRDNLTLARLQSQIEVHGDLALASQLRATLARLSTECLPFREHRNRRIAHLDLATAMKTGARSLPPYSVATIDQALGTTREYMNAIEGHYDDSETGYEHFISATDGDTLVHTLILGLRYEQLREDGTIPWDDIRESPWVDA